MARQEDRQRGFALTESMISWGTVAILAVMFFGVMWKHQRPYRERGNCQQNLRQIALAIAQYTKDSGEVFPLVNGNKKYYGWADAVLPYLKDARAFQCPTDVTWPSASDGPKSRRYIDYFYNANLNGVDESALQYIAGTVMLADAVAGDARHNCTGKVPPGDVLAGFYNIKGAPVGAATRHLDGANYTFVDGHVKWLKGNDANSSHTIHERHEPSPVTFKVN